jgi:hypothetical protein
MKYKDFILEKIEDFLVDSLSNEEISAQEVYDAILKVVEDQLKYHQKNVNNLTNFINLIKNKNSNNNLECKNNWTSFWEEKYYPEEYNSIQSSYSDDVITFPNVKE